ncbi:hypothetical protein [Ancylobacter sp. TS-1]|uniref:hypothetical protein n=1 Tax=Ancylobacter sp. TS-1 TaxID=1850374 RepID=UPI001265CA51|nr:hypothetical protein [Ancylobacter sp. TS-1]QFR33455.1 hypothetical protein GBB76_10105 [Ancylobacter sp. TS-1]
MARVNSRGNRNAAASSRRRGGTLASTLLHVLCACALLFVASVHRPPAAGAATVGTVDLSAYALPDGTLPVLCLAAGDEDGGPASAKHRTGCEACRLTATPDLLVPSCHVFAPADYRREAKPLPFARARIAPAPLYRISSRGPPTAGI